MAHAAEKEVMMRRLSERQAASCEDATARRCRCRCGGALHGAKRGPVVDLDLGDPHRVGPPWQEVPLPFPDCQEVAARGA